MLFRFCLYGFLKNQRYFEPFLMLVFLQQGFSYFTIGLLVATQHLTVNLLEIPTGVLADGWGRRRCMIVSFSAYILSFLVFAFASSLNWFVLAMALFGVGECFRTGTHKAMIFEWLRLQGRENERTRVYGLTRSWSKFGSALSSVLAAAFVIYTGNYRSIFLIGIIPYALNVLNLVGYPSSLDGAHEKTTSLRGAVDQFRNAMRTAIYNRQIRALTTESMCWDGMFHAIKDYLQPVLALAATAWLANSLGQAGDAGTDAPSTTTAVLLGAVYTLLFLLSGWASRSSHRWVAWCGSEQNAIRWLWYSQIVAFCLLAISDWLGAASVVACVFVVMHVTQNVWRPILIGRYDEHAPPEFGATIMSIESQARRIATLLLAPILGYLVDWASSPTEAVAYWPLGVAGVILSSLNVLRR